MSSRKRKSSKKSKSDKPVSAEGSSSQTISSADGDHSDHDATFQAELDEALEFIEQEMTPRFNENPIEVDSNSSQHSSRAKHLLTIGFIALLAICVYHFKREKQPLTEIPPMIRVYTNVYGIEGTPSEMVLQPYENFSWFGSHEKLNFDVPVVVKAEKPYEFKRYLFVIHSAPKHFDKREAIRRTWGRELRRHNDSDVVFILGADPEFITQSTVIAESKKYGDIMQYRIRPAHYNRTYMSIMMLSWTATKNATYVVKADDDILLNVYNFRRTIETLGAVTTSFIAGKLKANEKPIRNPESKWFVRESDYAENQYPPYLAGSLYVMSGNLPHKLYEMARRTNATPMEDVYVTGILATKLRATRIGLVGIDTWQRISHCDMHNHLARHYANPATMEEAHRVIRSTIRKCSWILWFSSCKCVPSISAVVT